MKHFSKYVTAFIVSLFFMSCGADDRIVTNEVV